jgi:hypothetical protein
VGNEMRDYQGMSYEEWLSAARKGHSGLIRDDRAARMAYASGVDPQEFAEIYTGGFALEVGRWPTRTPSFQRDRQELEIVRGVIDEELYEWGEFPLLPMPGYLKPIADDAGVNLRDLTWLVTAMKRAEHEPEADRLHHRLGQLVDQLRDQVQNASLGQIEEYTRMREKWIEQPAESSTGSRKRAQ